MLYGNIHTETDSKVIDENQLINKVTEFMLEHRIVKIDVCLGKLPPKLPTKPKEKKKCKAEE
jgi:hypothetical protein